MDTIRAISYMAGAEGIEPSSKVLETSVLPLNHAPKALIQASVIITPTTRGDKKKERLIQRRTGFFGIEPRFADWIDDESPDSEDDRKNL